MKQLPHVVFFVFAVLCFVLDLDFDVQNLNYILNAPSSNFIFGTDELGRDLLSRILWGAQVSLSVGGLSTLVALVLGVSVGLFSAWLGGWVDRLIMRAIDIFLSLPNLVLLILLNTFLSPFFTFFVEGPLRAVVSMTLSLSLISWVSFAKISRQQALSDLKKPFVESAKASGAGDLWVLCKHLLPLQMSSLISLFIYKMSSNILYESFLSFLGMGIQPPYSSWGNLLNSGWNQFPSHLHTMIAPAGAIFFVILYLQWASKSIIKRPQVRFY